MTDLGNQQRRRAGERMTADGSRVMAEHESELSRLRGDLERVTAERDEMREAANGYRDGLTTVLAFTRDAWIAEKVNDTLELYDWDDSLPPRVETPTRP